MGVAHSNPALFLDRDGVVNVDDGYINSFSRIIFNDAIFKIARFFKQKHYKIIVVTNQSGIGRGFITTDQYEEISALILKKFDDENCSIDLILTATVNPEDFTAPPEEKYIRKPNPGMIFKAKSVLDLDLSRSILIGDNVSDMQAGESAGIPNLYLVNNSAALSDYFESYTNLEECLVRLTDVFDL